MTWLTTAYEAITYLKENPEQIEPVVAERRINPDAMAGVYMELWSDYRECLEPHVKGLLLEAHDAVANVLQAVIEPVQDIYQEILLDFEKGSDYQYLRRIKAAETHIHHFGMWAQENDLIDKCITHLLDGTNSALYLLHRHYVCLKDRDHTATARILLRHEAWRLYLHLGHDENWMFPYIMKLLQLATRLSPQMVIVPFIERYNHGVLAHEDRIEDIEIEWLQAIYKSSFRIYSPNPLI